MKLPASSAPLRIRAALPSDEATLWADLLQPTFSAGETYCVPREATQAEAVSYWCGKPHQAFVVHDTSGELLGTYFLTPNQARQGGGGHVANCGFIVAERARGRGVAKRMLNDALARARKESFLAMQFNFVVACGTLLPRAP